MAGFYIYSDQHAIAAELVGFAKEAGMPARVITFCQMDADALKNCGADKVYVLSGDSPMPESYGKAVAAFLKKEGADLFLVGATATGRDLAASVAGYLDAAMASDVLSLKWADGTITTERMTFGGAAVKKEMMTGLSIVTIPGGCFEPIEGAADIVNVTAESDPRVSLVETAAIEKVGVDLNAAEKVVCVGLGLEKEEDMQMARELANILGAEIACSRGIAEERHWLPVEQYIGISGAVIKPQLYLAMGVSGQVQHTIGIRDSKVIVAVNNNEKAPIFKVCDYGIVGDMYEVIPLLTAALKK